MEEYLTCSVCFDTYDDGVRQPKMLHGCGHTLCKSCIGDLLKIPQGAQGGFFGEPATKTSINCPICKKISAFKIPKNNQAIGPDTFFTNYSLLNVIANQRDKSKSFENCPKHKLAANVICFEEKCNEEGLSCFDCLRKSHLLCRPVFLVDGNTLKERISFQDYSISKKEFDDRIDRNCDEVVSTFEGFFEGAISKFKERLAEVYVNWREISSDFRPEYLKRLKTVESEDPNSNLLIVTPLNK
jgi:hypothetical protein